jgi:YhcH/YjgK/YiaL family protein
MIFDILANADRYASVHPLFAECFAFLRKTDLAALPVGRQPLGSSGCTVIVGEAAPKTKESSRLEGHRAFIDIQVMVAGEELIGYVPRVRCAEKSNDVANDFQELQGTAEYLTLRPGCFAIYFPEDGHQPGIGTGAYTGPIRKIVIKVPVGR